MYEVEIKTTDIGFYFDGTVIAPVVIEIPDAVAMGTRVSFVIPMRLKLRLIEGVNVWDMPEVCFIQGVRKVCH